MVKGFYVSVARTVHSRDKGKSRYLAKRAWISLIRHDCPWALALCCLKSSVSKRETVGIASG